MLHFEVNCKIVNVKGIDVNMTSASKKCDICHCWHFFRYRLIMLSINLSNIAMLNIHGVDYHYIIKKISKHKAVNILQNADFSDESGTL